MHSLASVTSYSCSLCAAFAKLGVYMMNGTNAVRPVRPTYLSCVCTVNVALRQGDALAATQALNQLWDLPDLTATERNRAHELGNAVQRLILSQWLAANGEGETA